MNAELCKVFKSSSAVVTEPVYVCFTLNALQHDVYALTVVQIDSVRLKKVLSQWGKMQRNTEQIGTSVEEN